MQQSRRGEPEQRRAGRAQASPLRWPRPDGAAAAAAAAMEEGGRYRFVLDVAGFAPEELSVQLAGRRLTVRGKRDRRSEAPDGCVSHQYREVRKAVLLPDDADLEALACALDADGRLCVRAPRLPAAPQASPFPVAVRGEPASPDAQRPAAPEDTGGAAAAAAAAAP